MPDIDFSPALPWDGRGGVITLKEPITFDELLLGKLLAQIGTGAYTPPSAGGDAGDPDVAYWNVDGRSYFIRQFSGQSRELTLETSSPAPATPITDIKIATNAAPELPWAAGANGTLFLSAPVASQYDLLHGGVMVKMTQDGAIVDAVWNLYDNTPALFLASDTSRSRPIYGLAGGTTFPASALRLLWIPSQTEGAPSLRSFEQFVVPASQPDEFNYRDDGTVVLTFDRVLTKSEVARRLKAVLVSGYNYQVVDATGLSELRWTTPDMSIVATAQLSDEQSSVQVHIVSIRYLIRFVLTLE